MPDTEQMVHGLEPLLAFGVVCTADVHASLELALGVVAEEGEDLQDGRRGTVEGELVAEDGELLDVLRQALRQVRAVRVQRRGSIRVLGRRVVWRSRFGKWRRGRWMRG